MKYSDSAEKSAEYLRLALPLMSKQDAPMHPVSYAVWYDYVAESNDEQSRQIGASFQQLMTDVSATAARYGGEEFVVLLPDTPPEGARRLAENIRAIVERCRIKRAADNGAVANITISIGIAGFRLGEAVHDLVARADAALYAAKAGGRNRVAVAAD